MSDAEVRSFFETYREAFDRLDGDAVTDLWHTPAAIAHTRADAEGGQLTLWHDDAPMRANHRALCAQYRATGYHRADFEIGDCVSLGTHHAFAHLHWSLWRNDGSLLQSFRTGYNLLRTAGGIRVVLATAYEEELARMKVTAAALSIDNPGSSHAAE